jgi:hypothetical protein
VHPLDVLRRTLERQSQGLRKGVERGAPSRSRNLQSLQFDAIQFSGERTEGVVAVATNPRDDARGALTDRRVGSRRAIEERSAIRN